MQLKLIILVEDAANSVNLSYDAISRACSRINKTSAGYIWRYSNDPEVVDEELIIEKLIQKCDMNNIHLEYFSTMNEAVSSLNLKDPKQLRYAIRDSKPYKNFLWKCQDKRIKLSNNE